MLPFSMRSAMERLSKRRRAQTQRQGFADPVKLLFGGGAHRPIFCCVLQVVIRTLSLGVACLFQQFRHIGPQFPPRLLLLVRELL